MSAGRKVSRVGMAHSPFWGCGGQDAYVQPLVVSRKAINNHKWCFLHAEWAAYMRAQGTPGGAMGVVHKIEHLTLQAVGASAALLFGINSGCVR